MGGDVGTINIFMYVRSTLFFRTVETGFYRSNKKIQLPKGTKVP